MKALTAAMFVLGVLSWPVLAAESDASRPWLKGVATPDELAGIHTVHAEADVEVSDGKNFSTTVVYHDPQRAAFRIHASALFPASFSKRNCSAIFAFKR